MKRKEMLIEADELLHKIDDPNLRIYDATILFFNSDSEQSAYEQYLSKHIAGASFFDHEQFSDATSSYMYMVLPEAALAKQIGDIGISVESEVIFYTPGVLPCATRAWWVLHYAGHNNVRVLNGGLDAWIEAGGAIAQGGSTYSGATFSGPMRPQVFADKAEVLASIGNAQVCTVNTLNLEAYGNRLIKGSSLLSCSDLMMEMTAFVPEDEMAAILKDEAQHKRIITYCGGGIAATVNGMAHLMAGNQNVAVYDGSMDEWLGEELPLDIGEAEQL